MWPFDFKVEKKLYKICNKGTWTYFNLIVSHCMQTLLCKKNYFECKDSVKQKYGCWNVDKQENTLFSH